MGFKGEEKVCPGFTNIGYVTKLKSNASSEQLANLIKTVENQCPVLDMLTRKVKMNGSTIINNKEWSHQDKVA